MIYLTRVLPQHQPSLSSPSRPPPTRLGPIMQASRNDVDVESPATMANECKSEAPQSGESLSRLGRLLRALKIKKAETTAPPMDEQNVYVIPSVQPAAELYPSTMNFRAFIIELHRTSHRYPSSELFLSVMKASADNSSFPVASPSSSSSLEDQDNLSPFPQQQQTKLEDIEEEQTTDAETDPEQNECRLSESDTSTTSTGGVPFVEGDSHEDLAASAKECDAPQDAEEIPAEANDSSLSSYSMDIHENNDLQTTEVNAEMTD